MKRSKFSLSYTKLLSGDMGELLPIGLTEVLPGDAFQHATSLLVRSSPLLAPVMSPANCRIHHWFVPHRLVWDSWEDFITGGPDGNDDSAFPTITMPAETGAAVGSLADYLGVPTGVADLEVSALPFRGYALIFNEWYRDQDLQTELPVDTGDGDDTTTSTALQNVGWEKDYFTSARPWEQKGPAITIPLGDTAPVRSDGNQWFANNGAVDAAMQSQTSAIYMGRTAGNWGSAAPIKHGTIADPSATGLETDLSSASAITINLLREAFALQRFEEARARYGSRYVEYLRYLGIRSSDARLQRPEYLGGGQNAMQWSEVLATAEGTELDVGDMKGHGISAIRSNRYRRFFEEHGYVFTFLSVKPKTLYMQGLFRHWNRRTKEDFWQQELQHIGQQAVLNKEVYAPHSEPEGIFGYQDRYDEYRRSESLVSGEFRTSELDFWHQARSFSGDIALNASFVKSVPTKRINAVQTNDVLYILARHSLQARRLVAPTGSSYIF